MPTPKPQLFWAVFSRTDGLLWYTIQHTRRIAIDVFVSDSGRTWKHWWSRGYRVARVEVREVVKL